MKKILWIIVFLLEGLCIFSQTVTLPRKEYEPKSLDPVYTLDIPSNFINGEPRPECNYYADTVERFLAGMEVMDDETFQEIKGYWILNGTPKSKKSPSGFYYGVEEITIEREKEYPVSKLKDSNYVPKEDDIQDDPVYYRVEKNVPIICNSGASVLYQNKFGEIYFKSSAWGILKKLIFTDSGIYLYHLKYDQWELDTLYNNGKYWYIKNKAKNG